MNTVLTQPMYEWNKLDWKRIQARVFKLQKRIYQAERRADVKTVRKLQRLLIKSWSAKLLAVRRITQDNQGKRTAGVDGVKSLTPRERLKLTESLSLKTKATPVRRVWIPKPGKPEKRPLGIPTITERAKQTLVKFALEAEWESKFEPNSYGFRPGRSCWDAIGAIYVGINRKAKWVLDADIKECFERINQTALLQKINTSPLITRQIKAWLKGGVLDGEKLFPTTHGTPQGGAISPLLANIALHGMETIIKQAFPKGRNLQNPPLVIRYADDFVCMHENREIVERCQQIISEWLANMGLELKSSKTRITHTLNKSEGEAGFNFLGFNIRQYRVGKNRTGNGADSKPLGFKTFIKPSQESISSHCQKLGGMVKRMKGIEQEQLILALNPVINGWSRYYSTVCSKKTFGRLSNILWQKLRAWANRRHPNKGQKWIMDKYWRVNDGRGWVFAPRQRDVRLRSHAETPIVRHTKIQSQRSPFDGDWIYWSSRLGHYPEISRRKAKLLKRQKGKCRWCGLYFCSEEVLEVDHRIPKALRGKDTYDNLQIIHKHCHDTKTAEELEIIRGVNDNH
jgi:RNA-directed DNA polymerase